MDHDRLFLIRQVVERAIAVHHPLAEDILKRQLLSKVQRSGLGRFAEAE